MDKICFNKIRQHEKNKICKDEQETFWSVIKKERDFQGCSWQEEFEPPSAAIISKRHCALYNRPKATVQ